METIEILPVSSLEPQMREILSPLRSAAHEAVEDLMFEAFREVGALLARSARESNKNITFDKQACGLAPMLLQQIYAHATDDTLADWLMESAGRDRYRRFSDFLDLYRIQMDDFKLRHPKAFQRWSAEEDAELLRLYDTATANGKKVRWRELEAPTGRNANALKLRLTRLGVDLGDDVGRPRRQ